MIVHTRWLSPEKQSVMLIVESSNLCIIVSILLSISTHCFFPTGILSVYYILESIQNKSRGSSGCCGKLHNGWLQITARINTISLIYKTASQLSVLWQTLMVQPLTYSRLVLSIKVSLVLPSSLKVELWKCCQSKSVLSLESPSKSYPYVGEMVHICRQNETCRQNESRRTEM